MPDQRDLPRIVIIVGPTASGKSTLALRLAHRSGGEIVSADSMQVYRYMDVGTAKPSPEARSLVRHHLIDVVNPDEHFNASKFLELASRAVDDINVRGKRVFVAGGTGLYIRALTGGLIRAPGQASEFREELKREAAAHGRQSLHDMLERLDPETARRIHPNDAVRTIRALEALRLTGESITALQMQHGFRQRRYDFLQIGLRLERAELYRRIDERALEMVEKGLVEETRRLLDMGYGEDLKPMQALGYKRIIEYLKGLCGLEEALDRIRTDTRRYAKRQLTWFRKEDGIEWRSPDDPEIDRLVEDYLGL